MGTPVVTKQPASKLPTLPDVIEKLSRMSKPEREAILSKMSDSARQRIEKGLAHLDSMDPIQRQKALERFRMFASLDAKEKDDVRESVERFRALPKRRQQVIKAEIDILHQLPKPQREQRVASEDYKSRFSVDERSILEQMTVVMPRF